MIWKVKFKLKDQNLGAVVVIIYGQGETPNDAIADASGKLSDNWVGIASGNSKIIEAQARKVQKWN